MSLDFFLAHPHKLHVCVICAVGITGTNCKDIFHELSQNAILQLCQSLYRKPEVIGTCFQDRGFMDCVEVQCIYDL